jgi:hypothetical protein
MTGGKQIIAIYEYVTKNGGISYITSIYIAGQREGLSQKTKVQASIFFLAVSFRCI